MQTVVWIENSVIKLDHVLIIELKSKLPDILLY